MNSLKISNYLLFPDNNDCFLTAMPYKKPVQAIKKKVLIASSSMSYVIERLLDKDLITKIISPKDNRVHHVHLSQKGKDLMDEIYPKHVQTLRQTLNILTNEEELQLQNLLKKIGKAQ